jgi:DNA-binding MarR family transcriptional regulator
MALPARPTSAEAYAVSRKLHEASEQSRQAFAAIASDHGLTAVQARFILRLFEPTSMKDLAEHLACDKSNVTGLATRLTERGLVATRPGADRRVKLLDLTARGRGLRDGLSKQVADTSPAMTRLTKAERITLVGLLNKLQEPRPQP